MSALELYERITRLSAACGPSGFEDQVFDIAAEQLRPFADSIETDPMGNLIAVRRCGKPNAKRLLLNAHMDEIGFVVTGYDRGFLKFSKLGGVDPRMLPAREVLVLTDPPHFGVIDTMPPHVLSSEDMEKSIDIDKLSIDVGLSDEQTKMRIPLGTPVVFAASSVQLCGSQLCGKSLDDRSCIAVLLSALERLQDAELNFDLYILLSTQEELGLRGAGPGTFAIAPDYAVVLDVTHAKTPDASEVPLECGKGGAVGVGPNMNRRMSQLMLKIAEEKSIPFQTEVLPGRSGTDCWAIQVSQQGVSTALLSLPLKYMHTPVEVMDLQDAEAMVDLLTAFVVALGEGE